MPAAAGTPGPAAETGRFTAPLPPGPAVAGFWPAGPALPAPASPVWPAGPRLWSWGPWHDGELRTAACPQAAVLTVGQCLAGPERMRQDLALSVRDGRWERLTGWPGAYLLLVLDKGGCLTAYTDLAGQFPLYYAQHGGRTVVSTRATAAAVLAGRGEATDSLALAAHIVCPAVPELTAGRTAFAGVLRLGPGEALRIGPGDRTPQRWTHATLGTDDEACFEESAARLRAALKQGIALRARTGTRITSDFSGGMDSTSLAFLAADAVRAPLDSFVYHQPAAPAGDLEHARRYASAATTIRLHLTRGHDATLPYSGLAGRGRADQPDPATAVVARLRLRLTDIAGQGSGIHLTGEGGDALLSAPPAHLGEVAASLSPRRLARSAMAWGRLRRVSPARVAHRALRLAGTPLDRALHQLAADLERPLPHPPQWLDAVGWWPPAGTEAQWLTARTRRGLAELAAERAAQARRDRPGPGPGMRAALCELRTSAAVQSQLVDMARPFGVWTQAPFLDGDVVQACMRLPVSRKTEPGAVKPLLRAALAGAVPADVLNRRSKGNYAAEDYHGVRRAAASLRTRLARSPLSDLGIVEPARIAASLDAAVNGLTAPFPALNRLLGADVWLERRLTGGERG